LAEQKGRGKKGGREEVNFHIISQERIKGRKRRNRAEKFSLNIEREEECERKKKKRTESVSA